MHNPQVSVIIPCHNVAAWVRTAVQSALNQGSVVREIIAVENNSTDNTAEVLSGLADEFGITVLVEPKPGACAARNAGLHVSTSAWIQFLDADDVLLPGKISRQLKHSNGVSNIAGAFDRITRNGVHTTYKPLTDQWKALFSTRLGITSSLLLRREDVLAAGAWNESLKSSQEYDLMFRMMKCGASFIADSEVLTLVHERSGQISGGDPGPRWQRYIDLRLDIVEYLKTHQGQYFSAHASWYTQAMFDLARIVHPHAPALAIDFMKAHVGSDYKPTVSEVTGKLYLKLYPIFGFPGTDKLIRFIRRS
ncbi:MAG: glycosyltransferase family 2 protein [Flavobacteriales bacterium]|nr:glycosyltransferase family 2 protein [Flavobacteriales bacterium]